MNGDPPQQPAPVRVVSQAGLPQTEPGVIKVVVVVIGLGAIMGMITYAAMLILQIKPDGVILAAFISVEGQLVGAFTGMLMNTRTRPNGAPN